MSKEVTKEQQLQETIDALRMQSQLSRATVIEYFDSLLNMKVQLTMQAQKLDKMLKDKDKEIKDKEKEIEELKAKVLQLENEKVCNEPECENQDAA